MEDEAWRSVDIIKNKQGEPHVLQQKVNAYTAGVTEESRAPPNHWSSTDSCPSPG
jgi:hypothetical protein